MSSKTTIKITPFARKVYDEVMKIPRGTVLTYEEVARRIGHPRAARAVGSALGRNPFAPRVPCHRVVRADGSMGGYGFGGINVKMAILKREGVHLKEQRVVFS
jgi:O-6-methylguanine DNA methyltransferase